MISSILKKEKKVLHDINNRNMNTKLLISNDLMHLENYEIAVIEMGTSGPGNMSVLSKLVQPSIGVITTIGTAHLNKFLTKENILEDKLHIADYFKDEKLLFINSDNELLGSVKDTDKYKTIRYSKNEATNIVEDEEGISFDIEIYNQKTSFKLNLYGMHHIYNIVMAIRIAEYYGISYENIVSAVKEFHMINGRFKILENKDRNIKLIDDAYSSSLESVKEGLVTANKIESKRKIAVLGKMAALGEQSSSMHEELGEFFQKVNFDYLYMTGEYTKHLFKGALKALEERNIKRLKTKEELILELKRQIKDGDLIYVKAANTQDFNEIVEQIKQEYKMS